MRILQIAPPWLPVPPTNYGGIEWVVSLLTEQLVHRGHDVTLVAAAGSQTSASLQTILADTPSLADRHRDYIGLAHALGAYDLPKDFDVIHDHSGAAGLVIGSLMDGQPTVHTSHWAFDEGFLRLLYSMTSPRIAIVAVSRAQAALAPADMRVSGVVHNAVPLRRLPFRSRRRDCGGYLAYVGRANASKAPDVAVEVARRLNMPIRMLVKVDEDLERQYWTTNVEPLLAHATAHVRFAATYAQKCELLAGAATTVFPVRWNEPFALVPVESMACGTPVVAFRRGAVAETIVHGKTGLIVDADNIDAMCQAVRDAVHLRPEDCRRHVERTFSPERLADEYLSIYENLRSSGKRRRRAYR